MLSWIVHEANNAHHHRMSIRTFAAIAAIIMSLPASSQTRDETTSGIAKMIAKVIGLSPEGIDIWARRAVELKKASTHEYDRVGAADIAIGEELQRVSVDRERLTKLVERSVAEKAAVDRARQNAVIDTALRLSQSDRQIFGRHLVKSNQETLAKARRSETPIVP